MKLVRHLALIVLTFAVVMVAIGFAGRASAQSGHAEHHDWYQELKQPGTGYSCCNGTVDGVEGDCRPTRAFIVDDGKPCGSHHVVAGSWCAMVDGRWMPVPPRVVLKQLAPDGNSHICAGKSGMIYCFLGGSPKS